jgi:glyceraldehyde 3-phosphate dehydrogenase
MKSIIDGFATRVPVADCSFVELVAQLATKVHREQVNKTFLHYAESSLKNYLEYCTDPIVSSDVNNSMFSAIFDSLSTKIIGDDFIQIIAWYDNETGYAARIIDLIQYISSHG